MESVRITSPDDALLEEVERTYLAAFPPEERRDFAGLKTLIYPDSPFTVQAFLIEGEYAGFITYWNLDDFYYVEHFAIDEVVRNGGIGGKALKQFLGRCDMPVVLEVERPENEISRRRIGFYERSGFRLDTHPYRQPPYRSGGEWLDLYLMTYGKLDMDRMYDVVKERLYKQVYRVKVD
ncbi:MAG: GNAT family N-acetyltransferase [Parabacteroides sp.]|nr:GNAT family N-acetyltransferase [Parabacteroides sp.]